MTAYPIPGRGPAPTPTPGLCLGFRRGVVALIHPDPPRLSAIAEVTWPAGLWLPEAPAPAAWSTARQVLARARRQLGLPRWCAVAVVIDPALSAAGGEPATRPDGAPVTPAVADPLPRSAVLLARAGLAQGWVIGPDRAARVWRTVDPVVDARLAPAAATAQGELAVGAALAAGRPVAVPDVIDEPEWDEDPTDAVGWAVQRIGDPDDHTEPPDHLATKQR